MSEVAKPNLKRLKYLHGGVRMKQALNHAQGVRYDAISNTYLEM